MIEKSLRLIIGLAAATACLFVAQEASAQTSNYYYPPTNYYPTNSYGSNFQYVQPTTRYYSPSRTSNYRPQARPATGYGANLNRNFTIKQELKRSQRTGQPVRNRGNVLWFRY